MAFKPQRQQRYLKLLKYGFTANEARGLSVRTAHEIRGTPYLNNMVRSRYNALNAFRRYHKSYAAWQRHVVNNYRAMQEKHPEYDWIINGKLNIWAFVKYLHDTATPDDQYPNQSPSMRNYKRRKIYRGT